MEIDVARAAQLAINLSVAGALLLALEVYINNKIFGIFGIFSLVAAAGLAFKGYGAVVGMLFLLGAVTLLSLGFLIILAYFPKTGFAQSYLKRVQRRVAEEKALEEDQGDTQK